MTVHNASHNEGHAHDGRKQSVELHKVITSSQWIIKILKISEMSLCGGMHKKQGQEFRSEVFSAPVQKATFK